MLKHWGFLAVKLMNWYKYNQSLNNLSDRNQINERIRIFKEFAEIVSYLTKYVFQNAPHARKAVYSLAMDERISSFPKIKQLLLEAHQVARDNYRKFADYCKQALDKIVAQVKEMERKREEFSQEKYPEMIKERVEHATD
jgi:arginine utilization protein RocB